MQDTNPGELRLAAMNLLARREHLEQELADRLRGEGRTPYVIHLAPGHPPLGALGYVEAARSLGSPPRRIFFRHMLPALIPFVLTQSAVAAPVFILGEIVLSFLNVGMTEGSGLGNGRGVRPCFYRRLGLC